MHLEIMKNVLITGGAGFIGSHLIKALLSGSYYIRVLDDLSTGFRSNIPASRQIEFIEGDIRDMNTCLDACNDIDVVFHMAAIASVAASIDDPCTSHDVNLTGTVNLLNASEQAGVKRFILSSSAAVYGNADVIPVNELQPISPQSPYATQKAACELYARNFSNLYGLETVILRYFNVFGYGQSINSGYAAVIPSFINAALNRSTAVIYGDGTQTRDFVHVDNVVQANILAATQSGISGRTFNVASGIQTSLLDLLDIIDYYAPTPLKRDYRPARNGEIKHSVADISMASLYLGYQQTTTLEEGLSHMLHTSDVKQSIIANLT